MRELKVKVSEAAEKFIDTLQNWAGYPSSEAGIKAPTTPLKEGKGIYFAGYREYTPADDARFIDWKASIRSNKLLVKKFDILKTMDVLFLFDVSSSMVFGSIEKLKFEYAAELIASLSYASLELECNVGLFMFNDKIVSEVPPDSAPEQFSIILNKLSNIDLYGGEYDLGFVVRYIGERLRENSLIIIISDFIGLKKGWDGYLRSIGKNFNIVGIMVRDPIDYSLNFAGDFCFGDPFSDKKRELDPKKAREAYEKNSRKIVREIESNFRLSNALFLSLKTDEDFEDHLIRFGGAF
jgi:uncharacterized protein (DUF58 family)